jgi:hypothetical protein
LSALNEEVIRLRHWVFRGVAAALATAVVAAHAEPEAVVGILNGSAVVVRQVTRYRLVEGAALAEGDIVETAPGGFLQLEYRDGSMLGIGESSRLLLKPRLTKLKPAGAPRCYLLEGWAKVRMPGKGEPAFDLLGPTLELDGKGAAWVALIRPAASAVFIEAGNARMTLRDAAGTTSLKAGDFARLAAGADKVAVASQLPADFLQQLPRPFRDPLPPRASRFAGQTVQLPPLGPVRYEDVSAWLHAEPGVRLALSTQWRSRASDKAFRAAAVANLPAHMEWERVLFPERFLPKKPPPRPGPASPTAAASAAY